MIGAEPNTGWLFGTVRLNNKGFILTGATDGFDRSPYATSMPGIYAVGDVRADSVKRVASAVGEGSVVIRIFIATLPSTGMNFRSQHIPL
jgi:thioredoxin reductase (NADPH)